MRCGRSLCSLRRSPRQPAVDGIAMTPEGPPAMITDLPASLPALPGYGESSLADLASSLLAALGLAREPNVLRLPEVDRACLVGGDGIGWGLLRGHPARAPFLRG